MYKFLTIGIPFYGEGYTELFMLLSSINNQLNIDFSELDILLVNDAHDNPFQVGHAFKSQFGNIKDCIRVMYMEENKGPGMTRQIIIDNALGEYITFCDADDIYHSIGVLAEYFIELKSNPVDILRTDWLEEIYTEDKLFTYITHTDEMTWMHGKVFKKNFLHRHNIRFHDSLRVHEDSYFLGLVSHYAQTSQYKNIISYVWRWHPETITRRNNGEYSYASLITFIEAVSSVVDTLQLRHNDVSTASERILQLIIYIYYLLQQQVQTNTIPEDYLINTEYAISQVMHKYKSLLTNVSSELLRKVYLTERNTKFSHIIEIESFDSWYQRIYSIRENIEHSTEIAS